MLRKMFCLFAVISIVLSSFSFAASAAVPLQTTLYKPSNVVINYYNYDYFAIFSDTEGYLISFHYLSVLDLDIYLFDDSVQFVFTNPLPAEYAADVIVRDIKTGHRIGSNGTYIPANGNFTFLLSSLVNSDSYSDFHFYEEFPDHQYTLHYDPDYFVDNTIHWLTPVEDGYLLSVLTEPVADNSNYFIVLQDNGGRAYLIIFSWTLTDDALDKIDIQFYVDAAGDYSIRIWNKSSLSINFQWSIFDVSNGFYLTSGNGNVPGNLINYFNLTTGFDFVQTPNVKTYGIGFFNPFNFAINQPSILWNFDRLNAEGIASQTALILAQLYLINQHLVDIEDILNLDLNYIQVLLQDIRDSLYNNSVDFDPVPTQAVNDYIDQEKNILSNLPGNLDSDIDSVFDYNKSPFNGSGAFSFINAVMQSAIFDNSKITALILFSLTIGIAVLALGRKLNG